MSMSRGAEEDRQGPTISLLREVSQVLGRNLSLRLDVPDFSEGEGPWEKRVKKFCVGLLENPVSHTWWQAVSGLGHRERISVAGSLFLCRKAIPSPPDPCQAENHMRLMGSPLPSPSKEFLSFVDDKIDDLFPLGWDNGYRSHVYSHTPKPSSCLEYSIRKGGARRFLSERGPDWMQDRCLGESDLPTVFPAKFMVVPSGDKTRGVTVASGDSHVLGPLHRTLYDYLSQFGWLLRGEARGKRFKSFQRVKGEVFVSGDYESATDNLNVEVTERILSRIFSRSRNIPVSLQVYAFRSLRSLISYPGGHVVHQQRGQLMGNFLSFPLLCLQNFLAFKFAIPRDVPVKINGDDIVFRCRLSEYHNWRKQVGVAGLTLSAGKTLVNASLFSVNSAFFDAQSRRVREIPVIRGGSLGPRDSVPSGGAFSRFIRGWKGQARRRVGGMWLRSHTSRIRATGRSVWGLGIPADNSQLHTANLSVREAFFRGPRKELSLPEQPIPKVASELRDPLGGKWVCTPEKIPHTPRERQVWGRQYRDAASSSVWLPQECSRREIDDIWAMVKSGSREQQYTSWRRTVKKCYRLMGCRTYNSILRSPDEGRRKASIWIPDYELTARKSSFRGLGW